MTSSPHTSVLAFAKFVVSNLMALLIVVLVGKIPSTEGRVPYIPANPLAFLVLFLVFFMLWKLVDSFKRSKKTLVAITLAVFVNSFIVYLIAVDTGKDVVFNIQILSALTVLTCLIAVLPFIIKQPIICFQETTAKRDSVFFATTIMWLSPFIAEMVLLFKWYLHGDFWNRISYMVLGGKGTMDILFFYGFWAFLSVGLFHFPTRKKSKPY